MNLKKIFKNSEGNSKLSIKEGLGIWREFQKVKLYHDLKFLIPKITIHVLLSTSRLHSSDSTKRNYTLMSLYTTSIRAHVPQNIVNFFDLVILHKKCHRRLWSSTPFPDFFKDLANMLITRTN